jgi:hypothetical protein
MFKVRNDLEAMGISKGYAACYSSLRQHDNDVESATGR